MVKAVIVEDDALTRITLSELLESEGFRVEAFGETNEALRACLAEPPQILITDLCVPGSLSTRELVRYIRETYRGTKIVFISGYDAKEIDLGYPDLSDVERYPKPLDFDALMSSLRAYLKRRDRPSIQDNCAA